MAWVVINLYSSHYADDTGYFIAQQICELLALVLIRVLSKKDTLATFVEGLMFLSVGELIQEIQRQNLSPNHLDYINWIFAAIGVLYIIIKRERTNRRHNKATKP